ncbi:hypothetical protein AEAC466_17210 [Asticcacaulis sp. AC466]|uniref:hypothetical protein n=1 Tax=Asticcacaulis sp. AC466 TaxID=1282362 RepID=UPI0003C3F9BF|nr:hypothetical protein [Asticcacaulis sp. AC466]ESQ82363.1 hypothetical protein AEAC466_17210 [Asticcacaulis sp. AC466]
MMFKSKPYALGDLKDSDALGPQINILETEGGQRVCHIPPRTWRSADATRKLAMELAATPVLVEALQMIARGHGIYGAQAHEYKQYARDALTAAGLWPEMERTCRRCGCTETKACLDPATGRSCHWVAKDLCNVCALALGRAD